MYLNESIKKYLDDLSAKLPAPGGGSAAAVIAALGTALLNMVCNFTIGKEKYKAVEPEIKDMLDRSEKLRARFSQLIDLDIQAFKSKDREKSLEVPLEICRLSIEAAELSPVLAKKGNPNLITDVACGFGCFSAAFGCARVNVEINLKNILKRERKQDIIQELDKYEKVLAKIRNEVMLNVREIIRG